MKKDVSEGTILSIMSMCDVQTINQNFTTSSLHSTSTSLVNLIGKIYAVLPRYSPSADGGERHLIHGSKISYRRSVGLGFPECELRVYDLHHMSTRVLWMDRGRSHAGQDHAHQDRNILTENKGNQWEGLWIDLERHFFFFFFFFQRPKIQ